MATREALWNYRNAFGSSFGRTYFRRFGPGVISSIGLGTAGGDPTPTADDDAREIITLALDSGINVIDTAAHYRCGRAEAVVGEAVRASAVDRDAVVVTTKGGFVPFDGSRPADPSRYVRERFVTSGILDAADLVAGSHSFAPTFLDWSLNHSLEQLGIETIDCFLLATPETQLTARSQSVVYDAIKQAFEWLERRRLAGDVNCYGIASWDAFRVDPDHDRYLSLARILDRAEAAGRAVGASDDHGFTALQLPFNVVMADAFSRATQPGPEGTRISALQFAHEAGLSVFTSASIAQGDLAVPGAIPDEVATQLAGDTPAQRAINFARSAPGVTSSLVGTTSCDHLREIIAAGTFDPLGASAFDSVFE